MQHTYVDHFAAMLIATGLGDLDYLGHLDCFSHDHGSQCGSTGVYIN